MAVPVVAEVSLGGVPLQCAKGQTHAWALTSGPNPFVGSFMVTRERAEKIQKRARTQLVSELRDESQAGTRSRRNQATGPLKLRFGAPKIAQALDKSKAGKKGKDGKNKKAEAAFRKKNTNLVEIEGLYVTSVKAGYDLNTWSVQVADRRWLFSRVRVVRRFNVRRTSGETRWNGEFLVPLQASEVVADLTHERATLKGGERAWTAAEVLEEVLGELCGAGAFVIEPSARRALGVPVQDLELNHQGPQALALTLQQLPGVSLFVDTKGKVRVFSTLDQSEVSMASGAGRPIADAGMWRVVDRSLVRPALVRVYLEREQEIRLDIDQGQSFPRGKRPPLLDNVLQVPDPFFALADGRIVNSGTWITFKEFFAGLATGQNVHDGGAGANPPTGTLTEDIVRSYTLAGLAYVSRFFVYDGGAYDQIWAQRFAAVGRHWRRSYRIDPQFGDRIRSFKTRRAVLTDSELGLFSPSPVFTDYVVKPHLRALAYKGNKDLSYQVNGWAADLKDARAAPVSVSILDAGARIIQVVPRQDLFGVYEDMQLGELGGDAPVSTAGDLRALWVSANGEPVSLKEQFFLSTIVSMTPSSPNSEGRLHSELVTIAEAVNLLGEPQPKSSRGPTFEAFSGLESARFAWKDSDRATILDSIFSGTKPPPSLLSNPKTVRDAAKAEAARVVSHLLDRGEGTFSVTLNGSVRPTGNLLSVVHSVSRDGQGNTSYRTQLNMPPAAARIRADAFLPEGTQAALLRLVQRE